MGKEKLLQKCVASTIHFYGDILKQRKEITNLIVVQSSHIERTSWLGEDGIFFSNGYFTDI